MSGQDPTVKLLGKSKASCWFMVGATKDMAFIEIIFIAELIFLFIGEM